MTIGQNICQLRKSNNMTQCKLAEKLGISEQAVSKWENDICSPDVSILPSIAKLFNVSIDRIFGFHLESYDAEVDKIIEQSELFEMSKNPLDYTYNQIKFLTKALEKYPNSEKLKHEIAVYYWQILKVLAETDAERKIAAEKILALCCEIIDNSIDRQMLDNAHWLITQTYIYTHQIDKALIELDKLSSDAYFTKIIQKAEIYLQTSDYELLQKHIQQYFWQCYYNMFNINNIYCNALYEQGEFEKYLKQYELSLKIVSLFDDGGNTLGLSYKEDCYRQIAFINKKLNRQDECLDSLINLFKCREGSKEISDFHISNLNSYFSCLTDEIDRHIHNLTHDDNFIDAFIKKFDAFLGGNERFQELKLKYKVFPAAPAELEPER